MLSDRPETTLWLLRHGEPEGAGRLLGRYTDPPLSELGVEQATEAAKQLANEPITAFYASDLKRSVQTAEIVASSFSLKVEQVPELAELDMGRWGGQDMATIWAEESEEMRRWWNDLEHCPTPGGESLAQLRERVIPAFQALLERHAGETVCLVAHGGVNRVILFEVMGVALKQFHVVAQDHSCRNQILFFQDGKSVVNLLNAV